MDIEQLRSICLQMPAATETIKWENDLVFTVGPKMFCIASLEGNLCFSLKADPEQFETLLQQNGIAPAPYLARASWIQIQQPALFSINQIRDMVEQSYELVSAKLTKKQKAAIGL